MGIVRGEGLSIMRADGLFSGRHHLLARIPAFAAGSVDALIRIVRWLRLGGIRQPSVITRDASVGLALHLLLAFGVDVRCEDSCRGGELVHAAQPAVGHV